jgi:hypothetical protein
MEDFAVHPTDCVAGEVFVVADVKGAVLLSVASVALGTPGAGEVVLISLGEAAPPAPFVIVRPAAAAAFLCAIECQDEVMGEHRAVEGERGHFFQDELVDRTKWSGRKKGK